MLIAFGQVWYIYDSLVVATILVKRSKSIPGRLESSYTVAKEHLCIYQCPEKGGMGLRGMDLRDILWKKLFPARDIP